MFKGSPPLLVGEFAENCILLILVFLDFITKSEKMSALEKSLFLARINVNKWGRETKNVMARGKEKERKVKDKCKTRGRK